jgi:hypothetical protein
MAEMTIPTNWTERLTDQLAWHWEHHLRPGLDGLTDDEYLWEPVPGCWSLRPRGESTAPVQAGGGDLVAEFAFPEPDPPPVTTIAWRTAHLLVGIFGMRSASHFGAPQVDYTTAVWPASAADALDSLDAEYATWMVGVRSLDDDALARPVGEAEGPFAEHAMADLILHITREVIHHGAEILLLRDLHRATGGAALA